MISMFSNEMLNKIAGGDKMMLVMVLSLIDSYLKGIHTEENFLNDLKVILNFNDDKKLVS